MRVVTWSCDYCTDKLEREQLPSSWVVFLVKGWDGTEAGHPDAFVYERVFHFCSEDCRSKFIMTIGELAIGE